MNFENNRREINNNLISILERYQRSLQDYNENILDYNRTFSRIINMISHNSNLSTSSNPINISSNTQPILQPNIQTQNRRSREYDFITYLLATQLNQPSSTRGLTSDEISNNTRIITYSSEMSEPRCPITFHDFEEGEEICQIIPCSHYFKRDAIMRWFENHDICPICRRNLRDNLETSRLNENPYTQIINSNLGNFGRIISSAIQNDSDGSFNTISYTFDIPFSPNQR